jgi:hypothetical protein
MAIAYPLWYLALCVLLGLAFAGALYYRDKRLLDVDAEIRRWMPVMAVFRGLAVSALAFLLLSPLLRYQDTEEEKPLLVFALDNSESMQLAMDSLQLQADIQNLEAQLDQLSEDFEVRKFLFGSELENWDTNPEFNSGSSDLGRALAAIDETFSGRHLGAVVMASDGIYNQGSNPNYFQSQLNTPLISLGFGDTSTQRDLSIERSYSNKLVYLGDRFSVRFDLNATQARGKQQQIRLSKIINGQSTLLEQQSISIDQNQFSDSREFIIEAKESGILHLRAEWDPVEGEGSVANNVSDLFIEVIDGRQKILILAASAHPDVAALRRALDSKQIYELEVVNLEENGNQLPASSKAYDLIILHQLPERNSNLEALQNFIGDQPSWFILGAKSDFNKLNRLQNICKIQADPGNPNESQAISKTNFNLFNSSAELREQLEDFPPLSTPFGQYQTASNAQVYLDQKIGSVETDIPLMIFGQQNTQRLAMLCGEGIWRWRINNFRERENHQAFDELVSKSVQYLAVKGDRRRLQLESNKRLYAENESVLFSATLYNASYEAINTPDLELRVVSEDGKQYDFRLQRRDQSYYLNAGSLPVGSYRFSSSFQDDELLQAEGRFQISPLQLESRSLQADHALLSELARKNGGNFISSSDLAQLGSTIDQVAEKRPVLHQSVRQQELIHLKPIFFILLALLSIEWIYRKWAGTY